MQYIERQIQAALLRALNRNKSVLLLGPRQTGKTTLLSRIPADLTLSFVRPENRQRFEKEPELLEKELRALKSDKELLVILDEVQKVPALLDITQDLMDRKVARFILTGSSARKLRREREVNLLPGRVVSLRLDPFTIQEFPATDITERLLYGALPGILDVEHNEDRETDLNSYVTTYLEEEVRAEALVRQMGVFSRFLELAASESGRLVNFRKLSQEIGVSHTTISAYYEILEDCLIVERIESISHSKTRKKLTKGCKYLFFDLGVRRITAREGISPPLEHWGVLFEQFVGLELLRGCRASLKKQTLRFWRDPDGPEVDWVLEKEGKYLPVEVKWTPSPGVKDIRHLETFLSEYGGSQKGYIVCRTPRSFTISDRITAIPWQEIQTLLE